MVCAREPMRQVARENSRCATPPASQQLISPLDSPAATPDLPFLLSSFLVLSLPSSRSPGLLGIEMQAAKVRVPLIKFRKAVAQSSPGECNACDLRDSRLEPPSLPSSDHLSSPAASLHTHCSSLPQGGCTFALLLIRPPSSCTSCPSWLLRPWVWSGRRVHAVALPTQAPFPRGDGVHPGTSAETSCLSS